VVVTVAIFGKQIENVQRALLFLVAIEPEKKKRKKIADILSTEIKKIKERYPFFEVEIKQDTVLKLLLSKHPRC